MPIRELLPNGVVTPLHTIHRPGHHRQEPVVTLPRNRRSPSTGMPGHHAQVRAPKRRNDAAARASCRYAPMARSRIYGASAHTDTLGAHGGRL